jgi:hypothetical protein
VAMRLRGIRRALNGKRNCEKKSDQSVRRLWSESAKS